MRADCSDANYAFVTVYLNGETQMRATGVANMQNDIKALFVRKGTRLRVNIDALSGVVRTANFYPLT